MLGARNSLLIGCGFLRPRLQQKSAELRANQEAGTGTKIDEKKGESSAFLDSLTVRKVTALFSAFIGFGGAMLGEARRGSSDDDRFDIWGEKNILSIKISKGTTTDLKVFSRSLI